MKSSLSLTVLILFCQFSFSQWKQQEFVIGTFADPRITYENNFVKDSLSYLKAKNAYINLLTGPQFYMGARDFSMMDRTLKLAEKFGMKLLVIDSRLRISDPSFNEKTAKMIISHFDSINSKAFEGYYFGGEFPQKDANSVKKWTGFFKKNDPDKLAFSYLLPQYGFSSNTKYESYLDSFLSDASGNNVPDVIAYDYYPFSKNGKLLNTYYYNLDLIRKKAGARPFWVYILSTPTPNYSDPTEYQLNFSVFCAIAYGAKGIIYFTYETIPERYNLKFGDAIIDKNGNPTKKYAIVRKINEYVDKVLGPIVMNSNYIGSFHATKNSENEVLKTEQVASRKRLVSGISSNNILAGAFKSKTSNAKYLVLVNKQNDTVNNVQLAIKGNYRDSVKEYSRMASFNGVVNKKNIDAKYTRGNTVFVIDRFLPGEAVLLEF